MGTLKSDLQQFRELEAFAAFGSDLDAVSQSQLDRGYRLVELLKQGLNSPLPVEEQVVSIWAGTRGHLDGIEVGDVQRFEEELLDHFRSSHGGLLDEIKSTGALSDEDGFDAKMKAFTDSFAPTEAPAGGPTAAAGDTVDGSSAMVDTDTTLREEEIVRDDEA